LRHSSTAGERRKRHVVGFVALTLVAAREVLFLAGPTA
jgi:hypothetical protein